MKLSVDMNGACTLLLIRICNSFIWRTSNCFLGLLAITGLLTNRYHLVSMHIAPCSLGRIQNCNVCDGRGWMILNVWPSLSIYYPTCLVSARSRVQISQNKITRLAGCLWSNEGRLDVVMKNCFLSWISNLLFATNSTLTESQRIKIIPTTCKHSLIQRADPE
jgi:hypothetical protein